MVEGTVALGLIGAGSRWPDTTGTDGGGIPPAKLSRLGVWVGLLGEGFKGDGLEART